MTTKTRYVAITSILVLTVGVGTGLLAYYVGLPAIVAGQNSQADLQLVPANASLVAYANVRDIMGSQLRQRLQAFMPTQGQGQREFEEQTGVNIETDIDSVFAAIAPPDGSTGNAPGSALVLAHGRFNEVKIEALMREHGAQVETYRTKRMIVGQSAQQGAPSMSVVFVEPGFIAIGTSNLVRTALDLKAGAAPNVTSNTEMMGLVGDLQPGNAWAVGRFDVLTSQAKLPVNMAQNLPAISWFSASANIDSGIRGVVRAEARDEQAASGMRDVVRGILALGRLQASSRPELQTALNAIELGGTGKTVSLAFDLPADVIDALGRLTGSPRAELTPR